MADATDDDAPRCHYCDDPVGGSSDRRVVPSVEDGTAIHLHFCDDDCLEAWESETA